MNRLQEVVQKFRSSSVDTDKSGSLTTINSSEATASSPSSSHTSHSSHSTSSPSASRARSLSSSGDGKTRKDVSSASPALCPAPSDSVWVTSASHPGPYPSPSKVDFQALQGKQGSLMSDLPSGSGLQGRLAPELLSNLSVQNTPLTGRPPTDPTPFPAGGHAPTAAIDVPAHGKGAATLSAEELHNSVLSALGESTSPSAGGDQASPVLKSPLERKQSKKQPKGTFEYTVQDRDTLVKIGAHYDVTPSELMKINKMLSRTVFTGQTLFIPDPDYVPSDPPSPQAVSPTPDTRPKVDIPLISQADKPPSFVPGHVVQVTAPKGQAAPKIQGRVLDREVSQNDELDQECLQKFVKIPARRVLEDAFEEEEERMEGMICRGTLLVTPNAIMFDPDVEDTLVRESEQNQTKFSMVVYMDQIKSVALFSDMAKMFWRQPKEVRAHSPRPLIFRSSDEGRRPQAEGKDETDGTLILRSSPIGDSSDGSRPPPDGASVAGSSGQQRASPEGAGETTGEAGEATTGRTSEELENMTQSQPISTVSQPGRTSEEVEHMTSLGGYTPTSPLVAQMSRSSELAVSEISLLQETSEIFGETRDFGPHLGRSSSEVHSHGIGVGTGRVSDSSPGDLGPALFCGGERSDSTTDSLNTPTQGFAPVTFTDRSPNTTTAIHPKPVPVQRPSAGGAFLTPTNTPPFQTSSDLKSRENRISEDLTELSALGADAGSGTFEVTASSLAAGDKVGFSESGQFSDDLSQGQPAGEEKDSAKGVEPDSAVDNEQTSSSVSAALDKDSGDGTTNNTTHIGSITYLPITEDEHGNQTIQAIQDRKPLVDSPSPSSSLPGAETAAPLKAKDATDSGRGGDSGSEEAWSQSVGGGARAGSSFSPLRTPVQHISSFFTYTTSLFRSGGGGAADKEAGSKSGGGAGPAPSSANSQSASSQQEGELNKEIAQLTLAPPPGQAMKFPLIQRGFSKEELTKALGPDPKSFLPRSDSPHFLEPPLYLQIRPGIQKKEDSTCDGGAGGSVLPSDGQPRTFEHRNFKNKMLEEYWFVVPRNTGDKLYHFLVDWQPQAYGDQDELEAREKYFYDIKDVRHLIQPLGRLGGRGGDGGVAGGEGGEGPLELSEDHFSLDLKTWEVLSAEEAGLVERGQHPASVSHQDTIDESNMPELIQGTSCIITQDHVNQLIRAIPRSMSAGYDWALVFSTKVHGYSLRNLYRQMAVVDDSPCLLFIKDTDNNVFGAYLSDKIKTSETFYGQGSTFLFTFYPEFKKYMWQGDNQFFINGTSDFFAIGSGQGLFGLWVDDNLNHGRSHCCLTFHNDVLTTQEDFRIIDVEAWQFVDCSFS